MTQGFPFTVYEAEVRFSTVDSAGEILTEQWLGGCVDKLVLEGEFKEQPVHYHGRRTAVVHHVDESWRITATNVRLIDLRYDPPRPLQLRRNTTYALVIVWHDRLAGLWLKRCYFGVKVQPALASEGNIQQVLRFTAEEMIEVAGRETLPDFSLIRSGEVYYINGSENTVLWTYDLASGEFTEVEDPDGRAALDFGVSGEVTISLNGETVLVADADGLHVPALTAIGGTFLDESPRLEFWSGGVRCASLSATAFVTPDAVEDDTAPGTTRQIDFSNPGWLFTIASGRTVAPSFEEVTFP